MTTNERRAAWRQYAMEAVRDTRFTHVERIVDDAGSHAIQFATHVDVFADAMLAAEDERFGRDDANELATARAHALEQQTRAENAEMALWEVRAHLADATKDHARLAEANAQLKFERNESCAANEALHQDRADLRAQLAASVPVAELRAALDGDECPQRAVRLLCDAAEQRAAAKPAEGGGTGAVDEAPAKAAAPREGYGVDAIVRAWHAYDDGVMCTQRIVTGIVESVDGAEATLRVTLDGEAETIRVPRKYVMSVVREGGEP